MFVTASNVVTGVFVTVSTAVTGVFVTDETVPFDKDHLIAQIEAGGGVVLEKFDLDLV